MLTGTAGGAQVGLATVLLIAVGLSMDCFAVSVSTGLGMKRFRIGKTLRIAVFFGGFQALMPVIGFGAGLSVRDFIAEIDHWIAFGLLAFIGARMIHEALCPDSDGKGLDPGKLPTLLVLSVATSIDALAVGFSFSVLGTGIVVPACIIGAVALLFSLLGVVLGRGLGIQFKCMAEVLGGIILIGIGVSILRDHLLG